MLDGVPLKTALVVFEPTDEDGIKAQGISDATGRAKLGTRVGQQTFISGAFAGSYGVRVVKTRISNDGQDVIESAIPVSYARVETSGMSAVVTPNGPNDFTFNLVSEPVTAAR
jgi:hypothetical protein